MSKTIFYFAFGSNLNHYRLHQRIGGYRHIGVGYLNHHRLAFNKRGADGSGKCAVIQSTNEKVWGAVCEIDLQQKQKLDFFEGVGHGYDELIKDIIINQQPVSALLYQAQLDAMEDGLMPFNWYKNFVLTGAKYHRLPQEHIQLIDSVNAIADNNADRVQLNRNILEGIYP